LDQAAVKEGFARVAAATLSHGVLDVLAGEMIL
jgi:hypothetical protein